MRFAEYSVDGSTKIRVPPFLSKRRNSLKINFLFPISIVYKEKWATIISTDLLRMGSGLDISDKTN
jgi:hypothetical protein